MPMNIGFWMKAISLLLEGLEISKPIYDARFMNDM
jgi:hypothetical protein